MKKTIVVIIFALMASVGIKTHGQDLSMIMSKDALRTYAIEQAANASVSIGTVLPNGPDGGAFLTISSASVKGIVETIENASISVDIANPKDPLYSFASVYNADREVLFTGSKSFKLLRKNDSYVLPPNYGELTLTLSDVVPIKYTGAIFAQVCTLDPDGKTMNSYALRVENGNIYFPSQLAGSNALLTALITMDGSSQWKYWSIKHGSAISPTHLPIVLQPTIEGMVAVTDRSANIVVPTQNGVGKNITLEYTSTHAGIANVSFQTTEGKGFAGVWIRKAGESKWVSIPATPQQGSRITFQVGKGIYYVIPFWGDGDLIESNPTWYPSTTSGGKG